MVAGDNMSYNSDYDPPLKPSAASPPTHPSSDGNSMTSHQSPTAASIYHNDPSPPHTRPRPPAPPRKSTTTREDCWSEDATFTLIEAWGERILKLNSGSLRQKHWLEVADAVNARHGHVKRARRSDVQCKNRIDTLKKKYKVEKALVSDRYVSPWPFFAPLDSLIGSTFKPSTKTPTPHPQPKRKRIPAPPSLPALPPPPSSVPVGRRSKRPQPQTDSSFFRRNFSVMAAAAAAIVGAENDSDSDADTSLSLSLSSRGNRSQDWNRNRNGNGNRSGKEKGKEGDEMSCDPYRQVAEAIGKFSDVYKRVEEAKQRQMVELEKQRMQFTKDLELERMKLLMESQVQLRSLKRLKSNSEQDLCRSDGSASIS